MITRLLHTNIVFFLIYILIFDFWFFCDTATFIK